ncbi:MAG: hypothetical protein U0271_10720 [Polyangiaceae bacterium]
MHRALSSLLLLLVASLGCGAKVVFTSDGGGGAGGSDSTGGAGGVVSCDLLSFQYEDSLRAAVECDPTLSIPQCDGTAVVSDTCGCPSILLNEHNPEYVAMVQEAYADWVAAGCGPYDCGQACKPATPGFCVPAGDAGTCQPN